MKMKDKISIIIGIMLVLMISILLSFKGFHLFEKEAILYEYTYTPEVSYKVKVNNSQLYEEALRGEEPYYLWQFVEEILPEFTFKLEGSSSAQLIGSYEVIAEVRGVTTKEQKEVVIWQKEFSLVPKVTIQTETDTLEKTQDVTIDGKKYKEWAQKIEQEAQVQSDLEVCIRMKGNLTIMYQGQELDVPIDTSLVLPLDQNYFTLTKQGIEPHSDQMITQGRQYQYLWMAELMICVLGGVAIVIAWRRTVPMTPKQQREKEIRKLFRLYGSRLVGIDHLAAYPSDKVYRVGKFEDLIKLAQEMESPIFYLADEKEIIRDKFYIFDKENLYFYQL